MALLALLTILPLTLANPTLFLTGDSTMAPSNGKGSHGFGVPLPSFLNIPISNHAMPGESSRTYYVRNHFGEVAKLLNPFDIVLIEFGMNDGGTLRYDDDDLHTPCPGEGDERCDTEKEKGILTYSAYIRNAVKLIRGSKEGVKVLVSGPIPRNPYSGGSFVWEESRFTRYVRDVVKGLNDEEYVRFVDHEGFVAMEYERLGKEIVGGFYSKDDVHPNAEGAVMVAKAFVEAAVCGKTWLMEYVSEEGKKIDLHCGEGRRGGKVEMVR